MTNFSRCRHTVHINQSALRNIPVIPMQHQAETASLAQQINQIVSDSFEAAKMMQQIVQTIGESFQVDCCIITIQNGNYDQSQAAFWYSGNQLPVSPKLEMLALKQLVPLISADTNTQIIDDTQATENNLSTVWQHLLLPVRAVLQIPVRFKDKICGLILLMQREPHYWTATEIERAQAVASSVAIAISQVKQTAMIATLQQQAKAVADYQTLMNQLVIASRSSLELQQFLQLVIAGIVQTFGVKYGSILLLKYADPLLKISDRQAQIPKAKATVICEWFNVDTEPKVSSLSQSFWLSECCLCRQAFQAAPKPVAIVDIHNSSTVDLSEDIAPTFQLSQTAGILLFPLESQGTVLGFIVLQHSSPRLWQSEELALLELVSAQVSGFIIQNQTLQQVQALVEERTAQLKTSLQIQAKLYEKTRQHIDQLRYLNQLKDDFLSNVNHELRTPLTSMSVAIRLLRQPNLSTETQTKYLDILEQQCTQETKLINDLLQFQELQFEQIPLQIETIDLKLKVRELLQSFKTKWADKKLTARVELPTAPLLIATEADSLNRILQELLTNASKYSNSNTPIDLKVDEQADRVIFSLTNMSSNISPEEASQLFDKFHRGRGITQRAIQGTGLGLALVKRLVQHLHGTIDIDVSRCPDSQLNISKICFTLTLPKFFEPQP